MANQKISETIVAGPSDFLMTSRAGSALGTDGMVAAEQETIKRGAPIRLSMWLRESPNGLQTSAQIFDEKDAKVMEDRKPMNGAKTVTFTFESKKLKPGLYRVVGYWGGNVATEHVLRVTK